MYLRWWFTLRCLIRLHQLIASIIYFCNFYKDVVRVKTRRFVEIVLYLSRSLACLLQVSLVNNSFGSCWQLNWNLEVPFIIPFHHVTYYFNCNSFFRGRTCNNCIVLNHTTSMLWQIRDEGNMLTLKCWLLQNQFQHVLLEMCVPGRNVCFCFGLLFYRVLLVARYETN